MKYRIWAPDDGERPDAPNFECGTDDAEHAAVLWVERYWEWLDCPPSVHVLVEDAAGTRRAFQVSAELTTRFRAGGAP